MIQGGKVKLMLTNIFFHAEQMSLTILDEDQGSQSEVEIKQAFLSSYCV